MSKAGKRLIAAAKNARTTGAVEMHSAFFTFDREAYLEHGERLYYFCPDVRAPGPYRQQRHVQAIIDIADDGTLAGVELIDNMPMPPIPSERREAAGKIGDDNAPQTQGAEVDPRRLPDVQTP